MARPAPARIDDEPLLDVHEAASELKLRPGTLYQWAHQRRLPTVKLGRALRFRRSVIDALKRRGERPALSVDPLV